MANHIPLLKNAKTKIIKLDKAKHIVCGVVLEPETVDLQGHIISAEVIEEAANDYMINSRVTGFRHIKELDAVIVQSYVADCDLWLDSENIKKGSWLVKMKIFNEEVWKGIEDGIYNSFSIGGFGDVTEIDEGLEPNAEGV